MTRKPHTHKHRRTLNSAIRAAHLTIKSIASALSVSPSALRRYRRGSRPVPTKVLVKVAALLRYQADRLNNKAGMLEKLVAREQRGRGRRSGQTSGARHRLQ
jgi:transcriptional regulator with XRE-family HTH domain